MGLDEFGTTVSEEEGKERIEKRNTPKKRTIIEGTPASELELEELDFYFKDVAQGESLHVRGHDKAIAITYRPELFKRLLHVDYEDV